LEREGNVLIFSFIPKVTFRKGVLRLVAMTNDAEYPGTKHN